MKPAMVEDLIYEWKDIIFALIIGGVVPGMLLYVAFSMRREARAAKSWPQTTGTVITSRAEAREKPDDPGVAGLPLLEYGYKIGARSFRRWGITVASSSAIE